MKLLPFILLLASACTAQAQIIWRTADGRDSIQTDVEFVEDKPYQCQQEVHYQIGHHDRVLTLDDPVTGFRVGRRTFLRVDVTMPDGQVKPMFAHRIQALEGMPVLFQIYDERHKPHLYTRLHGGPLIPVETAPDDAFHRELVRLNDSVGGDPQIARYLRELKPSKRKMWEAHWVIKRQNPNLIPRIRWGVGIGMAFSSLTADAEWFGHSGHQHQMIMHFDPRNQTQPVPTLFADLPTVGGVSLHPELTLRQGSLSQTFVWPSHEQTDEVYNYTLLELPLLLRYTAIQLRSHWLPYVEAGAHFGYMLRNEHQQRAYLFDDDDYFSSLHLSTHQGEPLHVQAAVGAGIEYRYAERHAAFLGARYVQTPEQRVDDVLRFRQHAWMIHLSFNL